MSQQQQQPGIQPSLADLDKPAEQKQPDNPTTTATETEKTPVTTPSPNPQKEEEKATEVAETTPTATQGDTDEGNESGDDQQGDITSPEEFYAEIAKLRGDDLKFEFPQDIDALTPAGVHHAIRKAEEKAIERWEETLQREDARAYSYMLHRASGGDDESFFAKKTEVLPEIDVLKNSVDLQQAFYKRVLTAKDILPEQADLIIKDAIDKNKLFGLVETAHKSIADAQKNQLDELMKLSEENQKRENQLVNKMGAVLQEHILQNKGMNITIPDARRSEFLQYVNNLMFLDRDTGRWFVNQEITQENMAQVLSALYYMHVKGNMDDIITNKADQKNVQKVRLKMQSDKTKKATTTDPTKKTNEKPGIQPALSEL